MRRSLGRAYPEDIENTIVNVGESLDALMASSPALLEASEIDASPDIAALNAVLVNEVIIVVDEISDDAARARLKAITDKIHKLQLVFREHGIPVRDYQPVPTTEEVATLPRAHAEELLGKLRAAYDLYPSLVDRYAAIRPAVEAVTALPAAGTAAASMLAAADARFAELDQDVVFAREAIAGLEEIIAASGESVDIERSTFVRIQNWIGGVLAAEDMVKRMEGMGERKPAEAPGIPSWAAWTLGAAALVGIAVIVTVVAGK